MQTGDSSADRSRPPCIILQAADEYLKGVLTEAAKDVHNQEVSDIMAMLRGGEDGASLRRI